MPGFIERVLGWLGVDAEDAATAERTPARSPAQLPREAEAAARRSRVVPLAPSASPGAGAAGAGGVAPARSQSKLIVSEPAAFDDVQAIAVHLRSQRPVVVSLRAADRETARRIVDFLSGVVFALDGSMRRISEDIVLCAPGGVDVELEGTTTP
ncbi:cell division protein SepF [Carboxydochorda subterranea]|uniref:Cell division protein SepF n=1 Tax=Carboxydichorda subterranea TaxID=3109565 RepID=A0ABZ1C0A5_9FIRM|nr:cell division protein SepF [Limnochorda sp. L945t]WRP18374.1 cell division protein SepF [Limnochorda sp. L945t]